MIGKKIKKEIYSITGSGITLTNNELKDLIKVIKYGNKLLGKLLVKKEDLSIFLGH